MRLARRAGDLIYATGWWLLVSGAFVAAWFAVMLLPRRAARWVAVRRIAQTTLTLLGAPPLVLGAERIPARGAMAVNHSSYMDAFVLAAVLPGEPAFVAKKELARQVFAGPFLRRLGIPFVERYDVAAGLSDAAALTALARAGRVLVFFPEGTFTRRSGLLGFYLGAFKVAAEAGIPIVPAVIRGTRSMLRGEQWFPRRSAVAIEIGEPVQPQGCDFASVVAFRDQVRAAMLARCGEPDLGEIVKPAAG
jgi:1-acyl-sn-glycerol-3-phosphate acyltransferase